MLGPIAKWPFSTCIHYNSKNPSMTNYLLNKSHMTFSCKQKQIAWKKKSTKYTFIFCQVIYVLLLVIKMRLFGEHSFNFHIWMALDYDTWCNRNLQCGILIEFVWNKFKSIFKYVGQTRYLPTYLPI
jgi:hypothetical protein